ncbi:MAG: 6-hydroxymethylpterin diphosphokinase MptE-like protein [Candidatus Omnitrophota bacterium]
MNNKEIHDTSLWARNLAALRQRDPELAARLEATPDESRFLAARAEDGSPLLCIKQMKKTWWALNHDKTPRQEAEQWARELGEPFLRRSHALLLGFAAGYHALSLFRLSGKDTHIWIVEPDTALFQAALRLMDFTPLILSPRVNFAVGLPEKTAAEKLFQGASGHRMRANGVQIAAPAISRFLYTAYLDKLADAISELLQLEILKFKTSEIQGERILDNMLANLPRILHGAPWQRLDHSAPNVPALVIAAGPSLDEAVEVIAAARDRALVIAVDTAHRILWRRGVQADLVVSLDFTELNARHFDGVEGDDSLLAAYPGVDPRITERYAGRTFFFDHAGDVRYETSASSFLQALTRLGPLGRLISYGSTAHAAYHAARAMGANPVILIGHDLSFPHAKWYADGAMQNEMDQPEREREELLEVPANDGAKVKTSGLYKTYLDSFALLIRAAGGDAINTSPHGAKIEGCVWMNLDEAMNRLPREKMDKAFLRRALLPSLENQRQDVARELSDLAESCRQARGELRRLHRKLQDLHPGDPTFRTETIRLMKLFVALAEKENRAMNLCSSLCSRSTLAMMGQLGSSSVFGGESREHNQDAQERLGHLFEDFERALRIHAERLEQCSKMI